MKTKYIELQRLIGMTPDEDPRLTGKDYVEFISNFLRSKADGRHLYNSPALHASYWRHPDGLTDYQLLDENDLFCLDFVVGGSITPKPPPTLKKQRILASENSPRQGHDSFSSIEAEGAINELQTKLNICLDRLAEVSLHFPP